MKHFSSLHACVEHIRSNYDPNKTVSPPKAKDINSGESIKVEMPAYLYRGESCPYPTTTSSMHRMKTDEALPDDVKNKIETVACCVDIKLQKMLEIEPMLSVGFLQHYGIPTKLLDVTTDLDVAVYFASGGKVGDKGRVCVFPLDVASQNSKVIDLRNHPKAVRPRRQSAMAFWSKQHIDIKSQDCIKELGLEWFSFELQDKDILKYHKGHHGLLDVHTDELAGVIKLLLDDMPKMDDRVAKWLSDRVVSAPLVGKVIDYWPDSGKPKTVELIPRSQTSIEYDEKKERHDNYKRWSDKYPETEAHRLVKRLGEVLHSIFPSEEILFRLAPNWPDGDSLDYLLRSRKMAFVYQPPDTLNIPEAEKWCGDNGYRLIRIKGPDKVTEKFLRSYIEKTQ